MKEAGKKSALTSAEKALRGHMALALWKLDARDGVESGAETGAETGADKAAFKAERKDYRRKAAKVLATLKRRGVTLSVAETVAEDV